MLKTPVYEAKVKMLISATKQVEAIYYRDIVGYQNVGLTTTQAEVVKSDPILDRTVRALGLWDMPLDYEKRFCSPLKGKLVDLQIKTIQAKLERLKDEDKKGFRYRQALERLRDNVSVEPIRDTNLFYIKVRD